MTPKTLITGGSGSLGRQVFPHLLKAGNIVRISSRSKRKANLPAEIEWAQASLQTGEGLTEAVRGVHTIIHAASDPLHTKKVDVEGTRKLLEQAKTAGVSHFIYISIVGIEHFPGYYYYGAKLAAEQSIERSGIPYTILRASQFHELLDERFTPPLFKLPFVAFVPTDFKFQLVDSGEVATRMAELLITGPGGHAPDMGGPSILTWGEIARTWALAHGIHKRIVHLPIPGATARAFREGKNTTPNTSGKINWEQYLSQKYGKGK
jgi:uncharacterized protein YbjT (DUF2867 family)